MEAAKYRISVLLDMSKSSAFVLTSALELAKQIGGSLEVFHVNPNYSLNGGNGTKIEDYDSSQAQIKELIINMGKQEQLSISYKLERGNVKHRVRDYLAMYKPDILVLGRRRPRFGFFFESITDFVINQTRSTNVLILGEDDKFHTFKDISLGFFGDELKESDLEVIMDLTRNSEQPVRHFNISKDSPEKHVFPLHNSVSYQFPKGVNALDGLVSYVSRTNIQLLCVPKKAGQRVMLTSNPIKAVIRKTKIPLLILPK